MTFKIGHIFLDTKEKERLQIIGNFSIRGKYFVRYKYLKDNHKSYTLRSSLLKEIDNGTLKFHSTAGLS